MPTCAMRTFKKPNYNAPTSDKLASMGPIFGEATFSSPTCGGHHYREQI